MRVCYVLLHAPTLTETFVTDEIAELRAQGHEVTTVVLEGPAPVAGDGDDTIVVDRLRARSPRVLTGAAALIARRPGAARWLVRGPLTAGLRLKLLAAAEQARRAGASAVHAHFAYRSADAAEVIGGALGCGHSFTAHAHDIFVENSQLGRRLRAARRVVTVCEYNRRWMAERWPDADAKTVIIPCSVAVDGGDRDGGHHIDSDSDSDSGSGGDREPVVLFVARLVPKKGIDVLIDAWAKVDVPGRLLVVGDGPMAADVRARADDLGLGERVRFLGARSHDESLALFRQADVFCLPCRVAPDGDRDSMPVVIKEAMAAGLPVVSTAEVAVPEMVDDGVSGLLVPPDDPGALAAALRTVLTDPDLRDRMGDAGRAIVRQRFDRRDQARALVDVFSS